MKIKIKGVFEETKLEKNGSHFPKKTQN